MERIETPALWRKPSATAIPVPVAAAPAPYSAVAQRARSLTEEQKPAMAKKMNAPMRWKTTQPLEKR
jgi:hypothetical protein